MDNRSIKDLIMTTSIQTSALITLWGLANYMNQIYNIDNIIIYQSNFYNMKITGNIFYKMAFCTSGSIMVINLIALSKYRLNNNNI